MKNGRPHFENLKTRRIQYYMLNRNTELIVFIKNAAWIDNIKVVTEFPFIGTPCVKTKGQAT